MHQFVYKEEIPLDTKDIDEVQQKEQEKTTPP